MAAYTMTDLMFESLKVECNIPAQTKIQAVAHGRTEISASWTAHTDENPSLTVSWRLPLDDIQHQWHPACRFHRTIDADWGGSVNTNLSHSAPVFAFFNCKGRNRFTFALSDAMTAIAISAGVHEEDGTLICKIVIPLDPTGESSGYNVILYTDSDDISLSAALERVSIWWENACGYTPIFVPEAAKQPMYSTWYSYHQTITDRDILKECEIAAICGMRTVIVDDGWQTDVARRDYAFCGDWEPAACKMADMKSTVEAVHALGMKFMLWYSVPFVGYLSKRWPEFKDKTLVCRDGLKTGVLDPRYPEVRNYLIHTYVNALVRYNLDGFKLDFIDSFSVSESIAPPKPGMDFTLIQPAVMRLMTDVMLALKKVKPDILIEFRQSYTGPLMRTYGNMFRVGDCPDDAVSNRVGTIDLRMLAGLSAVHSDMLMWHRHDSAEAVALQFISVLFAVPQISVRLSDISTEHARVLKFWLGFMMGNKDLLLHTHIEPEEPQNLYTAVKVAKHGKQIVVLYSGKRVIEPGDYEETTIVNGTYDNTFALIGNGNYSCECFDCRGDSVSHGDLALCGAVKIEIPACGIMTMKVHQ